MQRKFSLCALLMAVVTMAGCSGSIRHNTLANELSLRQRQNADVLIVLDKQACDMALFPAGVDREQPWYAKTSVDRDLSEHVRKLVGVKLKKARKAKMLPHDSYLKIPGACVGEDFAKQLESRLAKQFGDFSVRQVLRVSPGKVKRLLSDYEDDRPVGHVLVLYPSAGYSFDLKHINTHLLVDVFSTQSGDHRVRNYIYQSAANQAIEDWRAQAFEKENLRINKEYEDSVKRSRGNNRQYFQKRRKEKLDDAKRLIYYNPDVLPDRAWTLQTVMQGLQNGMAIATDLARYDLSVGMNDSNNISGMRNTLCLRSRSIEEEDWRFTVVLDRGSSQVLRASKGDLLFLEKSEPIYRIHSDDIDC